MRRERNKIRNYAALIVLKEEERTSLLLEDNVQISANSGGNWCGEGFTKEVIVEVGLEQ